MKEGRRGVQHSLFPTGPALEPPPRSAPLADRMRPRTLEAFVGQAHLLAPGKAFRRALETDTLGSVILWGPPGSGKTTLAYLVAALTRSHFVAFSAVLSGVKEIREVIEEAKSRLRREGSRTILFVDEIHRFNRSQQDAFLPHVERGTITLIGATTENPSFEVNSPLLSRCQVVVLKPLSHEELLAVLQRALTDSEHGLGAEGIEADPAALRFMAESAQGDARRALNVLERAALLTTPGASGRRLITLPMAEEALQQKSLPYDKAGEEHYNIISAFHKSLRGSDPDAALYWLGRMLEAGEDPLYVARRMVRFASEDIGNADPQALQVAIAAMQAFDFIGLPEGKLALAQAAIYLATAPKSNATYRAYSRAVEDIEQQGALQVPLHIRNAPTRLMADLGYGRGYKYAHDFPEAHVAQEYLPEELRGRRYYEPSGRGYEEVIRQRLESWRTRTGGETPSTDPASTPPAAGPGSPEISSAGPEPTGGRRGRRRQ